MKKRNERLLAITLAIVMIMSSMTSAVFGTDSSIQTTDEQTTQSEPANNDGGATTDVEKPPITNEDTNASDTNNSEADKQDVTTEKPATKSQETQTVNPKKSGKTVTDGTDKLTFSVDNGSGFVDVDSISNKLNWSIGTTRNQIQIKPEFSESGVNKTRKVTVDIPRGYQILEYSAKESTPALSGVSKLGLSGEGEAVMNSANLTAADGSSWVNQSMTGYTGVGTTTETPVRMYNGKIEYTFNENATNPTLTITLGLQRPVLSFAKDTLVMDPIKVSMVSGTKTLNDSLTNTITNIPVFNTNSQTGTTNLEAKEGEITSFSDFLTVWVYNTTAGAHQTSYPENLKITFKYPKGVVFNGFKDSPSTGIDSPDLGIQGGGTKTLANGHLKVTNDTTTQTVTLEYSKVAVQSASSFNIYLEALVDGNDIKLGQSYTINRTVAVGYYNQASAGTANINVNRTFAFLKKASPITITPNNTIRRNLNENNDYKYDYWLGGFDFKNEGPSVAENYKYTMSFDDNLQVRAIKTSGMIAAVTNVKMTTNKRTDVNVAGTRSNPLTPASNSLNLASDEYIKKISYTAPSTAVNSSLNLYTGDHGIAYFGKNLNNTPGVATINIDDENGIPVNLNGTTTPATYSKTDKTTFGWTNSGANWISLSETKEGGTAATSFYNGETIKFTGKIVGGSDIRTSDEIIDPNVVISLPEGINLDTSTVKGQSTLGNHGNDQFPLKLVNMKTQNISGTNWTTYIFTSENKYDMIANSENYGTNIAIGVSFDAKIASNSKAYPGISARDIFSCDLGKTAVNASRGGDYIVADSQNRAGKGTSYNLAAPKTSSAISVVLKEGLSVNMGIRTKDSGLNFGTYDGTDASIAAVTPNNPAEVKITYENTATTAYKAGSEIYMPIPKAGKTYDNYFNNAVTTDPDSKAQDKKTVEWSGDLRGAVTLPGFTTYYSTSTATANTVDSGATGWNPAPTGATWSQTPPADLKTVTMIKFVANTDIAPGATNSTTMEIDVDGAAELGKVNFWRTYQKGYQDASGTGIWTYGGVLAATPAGAGVKGKIFIDANGNGKMDTGELAYTNNPKKVTAMLTEKNNKITPVNVTMAADGTFEAKTTEGGTVPLFLKGGDYILTFTNTDAGYGFTPASDATKSTDSQYYMNIKQTDINGANTTGSYSFTVDNNAKDIQIVGVGLKATSQVTYKPGTGGSFTSSNENVRPNAMPASVPNPTAKDGYVFKNWTLDKNVTLTGGTTKNAGDALSTATLRTVKVLEQLVATANYEKGSKTDTDGTIRIVGNDFVLSKAQATELLGMSGTTQINKARVYGGVQAWNIESGANQAITAVDLTKLQAKDGTYEVIFKVGTGVTLSLNASVRDKVDIDTTGGIGANDFSYGVKNSTGTVSPAITDAMAKTLAKAQVQGYDSTGALLNLADVTVDSAQLAAINNKITAGQTGTFPLTLTAKNNTSVEVTVTLKDIYEKGDNEAGISGNNFSYDMRAPLTGLSSADLNLASIILNANISAVDKDGVSLNATDYTVNATNLTALNTAKNNLAAGTYPVEVTGKDNAKLTINVTLFTNTYNLSFNTDGGTPATIAAIPVAKDAVVRSTTGFPTTKPTKEGYVFRGWFNSATYVSTTYQMPAADTTIKANYEKADDVVTDGSTSISASSFMMSKAQATTLLADTAANQLASSKTLAGAKAWNTETNANVTINTVDLTNVKAAEGDYDVTFKVGTKPAITVKAKVRENIDATGTIAANNFSYGLKKADGTTKADNMTSDTAKDLARVAVSGYSAAGNLLKLSDVTLDNTQLSAINTAINAGTKGDLPLKFTVDGKTITITVSLKDVQGTGDNKARISGNNFSYDMRKADGSVADALNAADILTKGAVNAVDKNGDPVVINTTNITVNSSDLAALNSKITAGTKGTYDVRLTGKDNATVTIKVTLNTVTYKVSFDTKGGSPATIGTIAVGENSVVRSQGTFPANPTKDGYTFTGWYKDGTTFITNTYQMPSDDIALQAKWEKSDKSDTSGNITLSAKDFTLTKAEATALLAMASPAKENQLKTYANAKAINTDTGASVSIDTADSSNIKAAQGDYDVTFKVGTSPSVTVKASVRDKASANGAIAANDFSYGVKTDAGVASDAITDANAVDLAKVIVNGYDSAGVSLKLSDVTVDSGQLAAINSAITAGTKGVYDLKFTNKNSDTVTVKVTLKDVEGKGDNQARISGNNFSYDVRKANGNPSDALTANDILSKASITAVDKDGNDVVINTTNITVDASQLISINDFIAAATTGNYQVEVTGPDNAKVKITVTLTMGTFKVSFDTKGGNPASITDLPLTKDTVVRSATGFPSNPSKDGYSFRGWYKDDSAYVSNTYKMPASDISLVAHYEKSSNENTSGDTTLSANDFTISKAQATELIGLTGATQRAKAISYGGAKAWNNKTDASVTVDTADASAVKAASGEYNVIFKAGAAQVIVTATVRDNADETTGNIAANDFTYALKGEDGNKAPDLTNTLAKTYAKVAVSGYESNGDLLSLSDVTVDTDNLQAINDAVAAGTTGDYNLKFTAKDGSKVTVKVTLKDVFGAGTGDAKITANNFSYDIRKTDGTSSVDLVASDILTKGAIEAVDKDGNTVVINTSNITVNSTDLAALNTAKNQGLAGKGDYKVEVVGKDGAKLKVTVTLFTNTYKVSFDAKGGTPATINTIPVAKDAVVRSASGFATGPTKEGYIFKGWFNGATYVSSTYQMPADDITLDAHYEKADKSSTDGDITVAAKDFIISTADAQALKAMTGNTQLDKAVELAGAKAWNNKTNADVAVDSADVTNVVATQGNYNVTFKVGSSPAVTVIASVRDNADNKDNGNDSTGSIGANDFSYGVKTVLGDPSSEITKDVAKDMARVILSGYDTDGTILKLADVTVDPNQLDGINADILAGTTNEHNLTFEAKNGAKVTVKVTLKDVQANGTGKAKISGNNFSYDYRKADGTPSDGLTIDNILTKGAIEAVDKNGDSVAKANLTVNATDLTTLNAKILAGTKGVYSIRVTGKDGAVVTIKVTLDTVTYKVSFNTKGGNPGSINYLPVHKDNVVRSETGFPTNPTKAGYSFAGWYLGTTFISSDYTMPENDINVEAKWEKANKEDASGTTKLSAKDFNLSKADATALLAMGTSAKEAKLIEYANAKAINTDTGASVTIDTIESSVIEKAGDYDVTFKAGAAEVTVTASVREKLDPTSSIGANDFSYGIKTDAGVASPAITADEAKDYAKVIVDGYDSSDVPLKLSEVTVNTTQLNAVNAGITGEVLGSYDLTFTTKNGKSITIKVTLKSVEGKGDGDSKISGNNFSYNTRIAGGVNADDLTPSDILTKAAISAVDKDANPVSTADITVNSTDLDAVNAAKDANTLGDYKVEVEGKDGAKVKITVTLTTTTYRVNFDTKGGSPDNIPYLAVEKNNVVRTTSGFPTEPTRDGYSFKGWYKDGTTYISNTYQMPASDINLEAKWEKAGNSYTKGTTKLIADDFILTKAQASELIGLTGTAQRDKAIGYGVAKAWNINTDTPVSVTSADVSAVKAASGNYNVIFKAGTSPNQATVVVTAKVRENVDPTGTIGANNFTYGARDGDGNVAPYLTKDKAISYAKVVLNGFDSDENILKLEDVTVDAGELDAINDAIENADTDDYDLTFEAKNGSKITIKVTLDDIEGIGTDDAKITGHNFSYDMRKADGTASANLTASDILTKAGIKAEDKDGNPITIDTSNIGVDASNLISINGFKDTATAGDYKVEIIGKDGAKTKVTVTLYTDTYKVTFDTKGGAPAPTSYIPVTKDTVLRSNINFPLSPAKEGYVFKGWYKDGTDYISSTYQMPSEDIILDAHYEKADKSNTDGDITIAAKDFIISTDDAQAIKAMTGNVQRDKAIEYANAKAWNNKTDTDVTVDSSDLSNLVAKQGNYNVTFKAGSAPEVTVVASVRDKSDNKDNGDGSTGSIGANDFSYGVKKADGITKTDDITISAAKDMARVILSGYDSDEKVLKLADVTVDNDELTAINDAKNAGTTNEFPLTFTAKNGATITVTVSLKDLYGEGDGQASIAGNNFTYDIRKTDATSSDDLEATDILDMAKIYAVDKNGDSVEADDISVSATELAAVNAAKNAGPTSAGTYKVTVTGKDNASIKITVTLFTITFKAAFDTKGGVPGTLPTIAVTKTSVLRSVTSFPADPTKEGYSFRGWYNGTTVISHTYEMPSADINLVAKWEASSKEEKAGDTKLIASDFMMTVEQAQALKEMTGDTQKAKAISYAKAKAWDVNLGTDINISNYDISTIKAKAGDYLITFTAEGATIEVTASVRGKMDSTGTISGNDFSYGAKDKNGIKTADISEANAIEYAKVAVKGYDSDDKPLKLSEVALNQTQLSAINAAKEAGTKGDYPLTFTSKNGKSLTITVTITDMQDNGTGEATLAGNNFKADNRDSNGNVISAYTEDQIINLAKLTATDLHGQPADKSSIIVDATDLEVLNTARSESKQGDYQIKVSGPEGTQITVTVTIYNGRYVLTFDSKGGSNAPAKQVVENGKKATKPTNPTKKGLTFAGWYTDSSNIKTSAAKTAKTVNSKTNQVAESKKQVNQIATKATALERWIFNNDSVKTDTAMSAKWSGVKVTNTSSAKKVKPGQTVKYTITVKNMGNMTEENIAIKDSYSKGLGFVSATEGAKKSGDSVSWNIESLGAGKSVTTTITLKASDSAKDKTTYNNTSTATINGAKGARTEAGDKKVVETKTSSVIVDNPNDGSSGGNNDNNGGNGSGSSSSNGSSSKTGDNSNVMLMAMLLILALGAMTTIIVIRRRRRD